MKMNPREFELIALEHVLARYRITGELPTINGQPFDLDQFKQQLSAGVNVDPDINVNIDTVKNEIVECDNESHHSAVDTAEESKPVENDNTEKVAEKVTEPVAESVPATETESVAQPTPEESTSQNTSTVAGKLFQFFNKG